MLTLPFPKGWDRHASALDLTVCLIMAHDDLNRSSNPVQYALDRNVCAWLLDLVDDSDLLMRLPVGDIELLYTLVERALQTPAAADLLAVFCLGAREAYRLTGLAEQALEEVRCAAGWDEAALWNDHVENEVL